MSRSQTTTEPGPARACDESMHRPTQDACPGHLTWSAFGAAYPDSVCATSLEWADGDDPGPVLCDADDELRPRDVPCPFCDPDAFTRYQWGENPTVRWADDHTPAPAGTGLHFHDGPALTFTATRPGHGEQAVLIGRTDEEA